MTVARCRRCLQDCPDLVIKRYSRGTLTKAISRKDPESLARVPNFTPNERKPCDIAGRLRQRDEEPRCVVETAGGLSYHQNRKSMHHS